MVLEILHWFRYSLSTNQHQAITRTNADSSSTEPSGPQVCNMSTILFRPPCYKQILWEGSLTHGYLESCEESFPKMALLIRRPPFCSSISLERATVSRISSTCVNNREMIMTWKLWVLSIQFNSIQYRLLSHNKYIYKYSKKIRKGT